MKIKLFILNSMNLLIAEYIDLYFYQLKEIMYIYLIFLDHYQILVKNFEEN